MDKSRRLSFAFSAIVAASLLLLTTCDAFKAGLGPKIDITGPTLNVKSIVNGAYLHGTVVLSGDDADVVGVQSVSVIVSINSVQVASIPATLSTGSWTASLDTNALSGGKDTQVNLDIKVTASSNKVTDQNLVVYFDNTPPSFSTMTPNQAQLGDATTYDYALSQSEVISGSVNDFGLSGVELDMGAGKNIVLTQTTKSAFSFTVDSTKYYDAGYAPQNGASLQSGSGASSIYRVPYEIIATDFAGNVSTVSGNFYVLPGPGTPLVKFTSPSKLVGAGYNESAYTPFLVSMGVANSVPPGTPITFHAFDMDGLDTSASGLYVAYALRSSIGNFTIPPTAPSYNILTTTSSPDGLALTPTTTLQLPGGTTITQGADVTFSLPSTPGEYAVFIHVADDKANKVNASTAVRDIPAVADPVSHSLLDSVFVSTGNPAVTVSLTEGSFVKALNVTGTVVDATGPIGINITVDSSPVVNQTWALGGSTSAWSYATALPDGPHSITLQGYNISYAYTVPALVKGFTVDSAPPSTTILSPTSLASSNPAYWIAAATATVNGNSIDAGSGVANVYYTVVPKGSGLPAFSTSTWTLAAGGSAWNGTVKLSGAGGIGEGEFTLYAGAVDALGNAESPTLAMGRNFGVDQSAPTLTETNHAAVSSTKIAFTLAGAIADTDALASLSITESKNSGAATAVACTTSPASLAGVQNATYSSVSLPLGGVVDASYAYVLTATDVAGKTTTLARTVKIDTTAPTLSLASIPAWVSSAAYTISGTGADANASATGVATIQYSLDSGAWTSAIWTDGSGGFNTSGVWSATLSGLAEGHHTLAVQATDAAGNVSGQATAAFGVDLSSPNLVVAAVPATITAATGASFTGFSGTLYDTNPAGVAALVLTSTQNGAVVANNAAIPYPGSSTSAGNPWTYAFAVDTAGHTTDGLWSFVFTATDVSGKTSSVTKSITIDTLPPTTTATSPSAGGWVSTTALSTTGVASDGTGTGVSKVYVKADGLYVAATSTDHSAEDPTVPANGWTLATGLTNWSASLTLAGEGRKSLWIKAIDAAGNMTTAAGAIAARVDFGLDLNPPALAFTDAVSSLVGSAFDLTGTSVDSNPAGFPTLAVSVDGGASQAVTITAGAWTFHVPVDTAGHANDGTHTYVFTATDVAGKTTTLSRSITVDSRAPTMAITQPGSYTAGQSQYWLSGATASLGGSSVDPGASASGVAKVYFKLDAIANNHGSDNPVSAGWSLAAGTTTWSATANLGVLGEGQFTLWTAAYDNAGNLSAISSRNFGVDQNPPTLTETNHPASSSTKALFTLAGAIGDTNALASLTITESKDGGPANAVTFTPSVALSGAQSATYASQNLPIGGVSDGSYAYVLTATDVAGKTLTVNRTVKIDTTPPTVSLAAVPAWVSSSAYTITGLAADPNAGASGINTIEYNLDGSGWNAATWIDGSGGANTSGSWNATLSSLAEGNHTIAVRATDKATNATTLGAASFGVDLAPPTLSETALGTTAQVTKNGFFTMTGSMGDSNPVSVSGSTLLVSVSVNGGAAIPATMVGSTWSYTQAKIDGSYSYSITATDAAGKTTSLNRLVLLDSTPPTLAVTSPNASAWVSSTSFSTNGTALDGAGAGVKNTYYLIDLAANDHASDIATWNATSGASAPVSGSSATWATATGALGSWSASATIAGEGAKILWVVASDKAGNTTALTKVSAGSFSSGSVYTIASIGTTDFTAIGASSNLVGLSFTATGSGSGSGSAWSGNGAAIPFGLDLNPPALTETAINTALTVVRNGSITFSGSASDSNALAAAHGLTVSVDGGAAVDVSFTAAPLWSYAFAVNTATHAQDGTHSFAFVATDLAGKPMTVTRSVLVDTTPSIVTVTSPSASIWTHGSPYTVSGTATDGGGAGVSQVWTLVDDAAASHAADSTATITGGGTWKQATGATNWTYSWPLAAEGAKTLWIAVLDTAGNWSSPYTSVSFGYDATDPTLSVNALGTFNQGFDITGSGSDSGSGVASIKLKIDSGSQNDVTVSPSWLYTVTAATLAGLGEGAHTVTVIETDGAGNQTPQTTSFRKDSLPPAVAYNNLALDGSTVIQDPSPKISGNFSDASGVATMNGTLEQWSYAASSWSTVAGMNNASLGATANGTSVAFSIDMSSTGLNLPDGKYRLHLAATDVSTPANALSTTAIPFIIARSAPTATIVTPSAGAFERQAFTIAGTASDNNAITGIIAQVGSGSITFNGTASAAIATRSAALVGGVLTTAAAHGLSAGNIVYFTGTLPSIAGTTVSGSTPYYVIASGLTATAFKVSATSGGAAVAFDADLPSGLSVGSSVFAFSYPSTGWMVPSLSSISGFSDGSLSAYVQVTSGSGRATVASVAFTKDSTAPTVAVTSPLSGTRSVGNLIIIGSSTDPGTPNSGVTGTIQYKVGLNATSWTQTNVSGGAYSWSISLGDMSAYANPSSATQCNLDGSPNGAGLYWNLPVYFLATDSAGNNGTLSSYYLVLDPNGNVPVITLTSPTQNGLTYGGQQRITGTATQPVWVHDVEVAVDPANSGNFPANPVALTISGSTLSAASVPFTNGMAVYLSGTTAPQIGGVNVAATSPYYVLNKTATTFQVSTAPYGAAVSFSSGGVGVTSTVWAPATILASGSNVSWYYDINAGNAYPENGATAQTVGVQVRAWNSPTAGGARGVISGSMASPLTMNFNSTYPKVQDITVSPSTNFSDPAARSYYSQITVGGTFYVLAHVVSSKGITKIERVADPLYGTMALYDVSSSYGTTNTATTTVTPPTIYGSGSFPTAGLTQLIITSLGTTNWQAIGAPAGATVGSVFHPTGVGGAGGGQAIASNSSGDFIYTVAININSTALYATNSGYHVFDIRATDMTSPVSQVSSQTVTLGEDNYYPTTTLASPASPSYLLNGSSFKVQGSATDVGGSSGPIAGLSKVVVYLARGGSILNINSGVGVSSGTSLVNVKDMDNGGTVGTLTLYPTAETAGAAHNYYASLDDRNEIGTTTGDHNGDGFTESLLTNGNNLDWWVQLDSTKLADGPVDVHYVVWDSAGNATHYKQVSMISNHAPSLNYVVLGTDLSGSASINSYSGNINSNFTTTNFVARNNLVSFQIVSSYGGQNGALGYSLKYAGVEYWNSDPTNGETISATSTNSNTLTLDFTKLLTGIPDAAANGAAFTLTVTDATSGSPQAYSQVINLGIQNFDTVSPTIAIAPFGQRYTAPTDAANGGANTDAGKALQAVSAYSDNVATSGSTLLGHVEYAANSVFADGQPNLSGQVIFRGKAYDNQRISRITATIPNFNGGAEFAIATWGGTSLTGLSGTGWSFASDSGTESVSLADGHPLNWAFTWDSSQLSTGAATNVIVTFKVYDFMSTSVTAARGSTTTLTSAQLKGQTILNGTAIYLGPTNPTWTTVTAFNAGTGLVTFATAVPTAGNQTYILAHVVPIALTVDVAPYITSISRNAALYNTNRSKYGKYPVFQGETGIVVKGFNLPTAIDTNNWVKVYNAATAGTADTNALTISTPTRSQFTMALNAAQHSGWLRVSTSTVEAINGANVNTLAWNVEDDGTGIATSKWNDDRYLSVWNVDRWANSNSFLGSANSKYPTFTVDSTGNLYGSWVNYATATVAYNTINGQTGVAGTSTDIFKLYDPPEFTDISIDPANNQPTIAYIQNTYGGSGGWTNLNGGSVNVWSADMLHNNNTELWEAYQNNNAWVYYSLITDGLWHNSMLWEHYGVKVARSGNNIHLAWYDDLSKSVKYAYFVSSQNQARGGTAGNYYLAEQGWINIDGGTNGASDATAPGIGLVTNYQTGISRTASVGSSVSIDVDNAGYPVIAYYDNANHVLRVAHASSTTPNTLASWKVQPVAGGTYDSYAGANSSDINGNVTIKVDHTSGTAYLAAYRPSQGQFIYTTATSRTATDFNFNAFTVLDAKGNVGSWSDMSLGTGNPVLVYQNKSMLGTYDGVKVAYWDSTLTTPDWETIIPPANSFVSDGKLSIVRNNAYASVPWTLAVGYKSSAFQVMYLQPNN